MSKPDYEEVLHRLGKLATKVDKIEEQARHGADNSVWRQLHFLRLDVHGLQNDMRGGQVPGETANDHAGDEDAPNA